MSKRSTSRAGITELVEWFALNPEGEISVAQAARKLGIAERTAEAYLGHLTGTGRLVRVSKYYLKEQPCPPSPGSVSSSSDSASA